MNKEVSALPNRKPATAAAAAATSAAHPAAAPAARPSAGRVLWLAVQPVLRRNWPTLSVMAILITMAVLIELAPPMLLRELVDQKLAKGTADGIWTIALLYLTAVVAARLVAFGQAYLTALVGQNILLHLRLLIAQHLEQLSLRYFDRTPVGDIMSRATNDVEAVNSLFTSGIIGAVTDMFRVIGVLGAMFAINARLGWMMILCVPVVYVTTEYFRRHMRAAQFASRVAIGHINSFLQETWSGMRVIHVFGKEGRFGERLWEPQTEFIRAADKASSYNANFPGVLKTIEAVALALVLWAGAKPAVLGLGLTLGGLVAFAQLVTRLFAPIQNVSQEWQTIQVALAGVERIAEVLMEPVEDRTARALKGNGAGSVLAHVLAPNLSGAKNESTPPACPTAAVPAPAVNPSTIAANTRGHLVIEGLEFGYLAGHPTLKDINLDVPPGQRLTVVGRTGAGKTSLLHVIAGVYEPWLGALAIDGIDPRSVPPAERRRLLGVVPQYVQVFDGTVRDNITMGDPSITEEQVHEVARLTGAATFIDQLPRSYDTILGTGGTRLSFGQNQILCLARALVCDPPLLLLDEPTSGMDAETEKMIFAALRDSTGRGDAGVSDGSGASRTLVVISHRLTGVVDADRVVVLANGRVVQDGAPVELAGSEGWYKVFHELEQLGWKVS